MLDWKQHMVLMSWPGHSLMTRGPGTPQTSHTSTLKNLSLKEVVGTPDQPGKIWRQPGH